MPSEKQLKEMYGLCLHLAGITDASKLIKDLLDEKNEQHFSHYVPISWFGTFQDDFIYYTERQVKLCGWALNSQKLGKPTRKTPIWKHYKERFLPAF